MKTQDWFGIGARLFGLLYCLHQAATYLIGFIQLRFRFSRYNPLGASGSDSTDAESYLLWGIVELGFGIILLFFTDNIIQWTYRPSEEEGEVADRETQSPIEPTNSADQVIDL